MIFLVLETEDANGITVSKEFKQILQNWKKFYPSEPKAKGILKQKIMDMTKNACEKPLTPNNTTVPPAKKAKVDKPSGLFTIVKSMSKAKENTSLSEEAKIDHEIERYLEKPIIDEDQNPLDYWKVNCKQWPNLSVVAKSILTMPASSGNVERLFSIAGALARSRRAKLSISNIEKLIICRNFYGGN